MKVGCEVSRCPTVHEFIATFISGGLMVPAETIMGDGRPKRLTQPRREGAVRPHELLEGSRHGLTENAKELVHCLPYRLPHFGPCQRLQYLDDGLHQVHGSSQTRRTVADPGHLSRIGICRRQSHDQHPHVVGI